MTLEEYREETLRAVRLQRPGPGEDWAPMLLITERSGDAHVVQVPPSLLNTTMHPQFVDTLLSGVELGYFAHIVSAWMVRASELKPSCETCKGEGLFRGDDGMIPCPSCSGRGGPAQDFSKEPGRVETVVVHIGDRSGRLECWTAPIQRPHPKRGPKLGPFTEVEGIAGRLAGGLRRDPLRQS